MWAMADMQVEKVQLKEETKERSCTLGVGGEEKERPPSGNS